MAGRECRGCNKLGFAGKCGGSGSGRSVTKTRVFFVDRVVASTVLGLARAGRAGVVQPRMVVVSPEDHGVVRRNA